MRSAEMSRGGDRIVSTSVGTLYSMILTAPVPTRLTRFEINQTFAPYNTSEFFKPEVLQAWNELLPGTSHSFPASPIHIH
jgi:hypothetical protein